MLTFSIYPSSPHEPPYLCAFINLFQSKECDYYLFFHFFLIFLILTQVTKDSLKISEYCMKLFWKFHWFRPCVHQPWGDRFNRYTRTSSGFKIEKVIWEQESFAQNSHFFFWWNIILNRISWTLPIRLAAIMSCSCSFLFPSVSWRRGLSWAVLVRFYFHLLVDEGVAVPTTKKKVSTPNDSK